MIMDTGSIAMLAIAATLLVGLIGVIVSIFATSSATHRRIDDLRGDVDRRFSDVDQQFASLRTDVDRQLGDLRVDFRDLRGRVDHIADSLNLGRPRARKRA